ncbi:MAG TPA: thiamine diphosphokinase [Candidatus Krumholzibacteria bacterium]|nr:thiamine diphosphokinase [Candidatus Krumholzibacteria bacterium]
MNDFQAEVGGAACPIFPKRGPRAVVLCDGPPPEPQVLYYWLTGADVFVCADAAGHPYDQLPRTPDVVIGDFDSLAGRIIDGRDGPRYLRIDAQDTTDSEKALMYVAEHGIEEAVVLGAVGWRLDHTLYNCQLLERFADELRICIAGPYADAVRIGPGDSVAWSLPLGTRFSLLPLAGTARGVTLEGAEYPLLGDTLETGAFATVSNHVAVTPLLITVREGSVLAMVDREPDLQRGGSFGGR